MDLLVLVAIVLFGYLSWYFNTFYVGKDGVYIHKGIFLIQQYVIPVSYTHLDVYKRQANTPTEI